MKKIDIGKIVSVRGLVGEIKVLPLVDGKTFFEDVSYIIIKDQMYTIEYIKHIKSCVSLKVKKIDTLEDAKGLVGSLIYIYEKDLPALQEGTYYVKDLIGLLVYTEDGETLGNITDVTFTGANDVYEVTTGEKTVVLIPAVREFIKEVNVNEGYIRVKLIEGMI